MIGIKNKKNKIIFQIFIMIISGLLLLKLTTSTDKAISNNIYSYNLQKNAYYKVHLKDNDFYENDFVDSGKSYLSKLTDYINIDFTYAFNSSQKKDINITYDVIAQVNVAHASNSETIWTKDYEIIKDKSLSDFSNSINLNENIELDFEEYNSEVINFKNTFEVPITATLTVKFIINNNTDVLQGTNDKTSITELTMNLNTDVFKITEKNTGTTSNTIYLDNSNNNKTTKKNPFIIIILTLAFVGSIVTLLSNIFKNKTINTTSEYTKSVRKILKNYGDIVAEIVKPVDLSNLEIIDVKNFDQILDVEEELRMPILFSEDKKNEEGCFVIIHNNIAYRYILRNKKRRKLI